VAAPCATLEQKWEREDNRKERVRKTEMEWLFVLAIEIFVCMFGWHEINGIAAVFGIGIIMVQLNENLLFQNSENNYYFAIPRGRWNSCCSYQLSVTIQNKQSK
jgi:hypothetical protein